MELFQDNAEVMMVRADDVSIPELSSGTVDIPIFNTNVKKLANGIALDRILSISFRLDINYEVYKRLYSKLKINDQGVVNPSDEEYKPRQGPVWGQDTWSPQQNGYLNRPNYTNFPAYLFPEMALL